jgi:hypothetical protein
VRLYHRTTRQAVRRILAEGFRDGQGRYMTAAVHRGVWVADQILDENEGARGDTVLVIEIPEAVAGPYEWIEGGKPYREFLIPAARVNRHGPPQVVSAREEQALLHTGEMKQRRTRK